MLDKKYRQLRIQAKARITWGDPPEDVLDELINRGLDPAQAAVLVEKLVSRRNREVRSRSLQKLFTGIGMVLACIIFFAALPWKEWVNSLDQMTAFNSASRFRRRGLHLGSILAVLMAATGLIGLWCIYRGICGLLVPQAEELSDVE